MTQTHSHYILSDQYGDPFCLIRSHDRTQNEIYWTIKEFLEDHFDEIVHVSETPYIYERGGVDFEVESNTLKRETFTLHPISEW
jgi:hypothetical protein